MAFTKVTDNLLSSGVGTGAGNILELDSSGKLPAVDGSNLTGVGVDGIVSSANATAITIDSNENVGIGVVPEAWQSTRTALQIGDSTAVWGDVYKNTWFTNNVYRNSSNTESYINASYASEITMTNGGIMDFKVAQSGTADAAISWTTAMTINNTGNVGIGTTSPSAPLHIANSPGNNTTDTLYLYSSNGAAQFKMQGGSDQWIFNTVYDANRLDIKNKAGAGSLNTRLSITNDGLTFNGDTASANALDDYEEGTWTPTIEGQTGASGQTYGTQVGTYTKVGNIVSTQCYVTLTNKGTLSGNYLVVTGLPFQASASSGNNAGCSARVEAIKVSTDWIGPDWQLSASSTLLMAMEHPANNTTTSHRAVGNLYGSPGNGITNDTSIILGITYQV